jgi:tetratricopeptide (TPR) repeat protein
VGATPILIALLLAAPPAEDEVLGEAEAAFHQGLRQREDSREARRLFREAAARYEELRRRGAENADLYGNLGNAYFLAGDLPRAILSYRHGLRLAPANPSLRANLARARDQVVFPSSGAFGRPAVDHRPPWLPDIPVTLPILLAFLCYGACWLALTRWWMTRQSWLSLAALSLFVVSATLAGGLALHAWRTREGRVHPALVIAADGVLLRKGNGLAYPGSYEVPLNRGVEAQMLYERGDWVQIELGGGEVGWVARAAVIIDTP